jgi:anti-sigma factor RsiW
MTHAALRRWLHSLLDGELVPGQLVILRSHLEQCPACRRELRALEATETLVARLPAALVPLGAGPEADARLALLARWSAARAPRHAAPRWGVGALGAALAVSTLAVVAWLGPLEAPEPGAFDTRSGLVVASLVPASSLAPAIQVPSATPYTWR